MSLNDFHGWNPKQGDYTEYTKEMHRQNALQIKQKKRGWLIFVLSLAIGLIAFYYWAIYTGT